MDNINYFLSTIKNDNTKAAMESLINKINSYMEQKDMTIYDMETIDIDLFIKRELHGKSNTTISATISRIKNLFNGIGKGDVASHLTLNYVKEIVETKQQSYLTPGEIYDITENLINYQDKALVMLLYLGFLLIIPFCFSISFFALFLSSSSFMSR